MLAAPDAFGNGSNRLMAYVFINERGQPFGRMGIGRMIERAGEAARLPFPVHEHRALHGDVAGAV